MKVSYKGYELEVTREESSGGDELLYFSIYRQSDWFECVYDFEDSSETVRDKMEQLKQRVDNELKEDDPWGEKAEEEDL